MFTIDRAVSRVVAAALAIGSLAPCIAFGEFDPTKGKVVLDDANFVIDFDQPSTLPGLGNILLFGDQFNPLQQIPPADWVADPVAAIQGEGVLRLGRGVSAVYLGLDTVAPSLRERNATFTMWVRPQGALPVVEIFYSARDLASLEPSDFFAPFARVRLQPTGRATSDGWRELSSGPVDFSLHGQVEARFLQILDQRLLEATIYGIASNSDGEFLIDGLSITDNGARAVPDVPCALIDEAASCGDSGTCRFGRCVDAHAALGTPPPVGNVRAQYHDRLAFRMAMMAGGRFTQSLAPRFTDVLTDLETESRPAVYWSRFYRAFDDLGDGHISAPDWQIPSGVGTGMCLYQGVADLLPTSTPNIAPLIFDRDTTHPTAENLEEGDVLVAVDGIPPYDWLPLADRYLRYAGDPAGRTYVTTEQLPDAAVATGAVLTFERCRGTGGAVCTSTEVETINVDLAALVAPLWQGESLDWNDGPACDFRFRRDISPFDPFGSGEYVSSRDLPGDIRSIFINGVSGRRRWLQAVQTALTDLPDRVLLDERTGNGGTFEGVSALLGPFYSTNAQPFVQLVPQLRPELDDATVDIFLDCYNDPLLLCGNFGVLGLLDDGEAPGTAVNARLAIVNGRDVSGNDYLPRALKDRPTGQTRIFAASPTYGAFGPIYTLPRILQELTGGSVQIQDTLFLPAFNQRNFNFTTGNGVPPDDVVLQRQSDAVNGVDTLLEAAKAWLQGDQP